MSKQCRVNNFFDKCMYKNCANKKSDKKRLYRFPLQTDERFYLWIHNSGSGSKLATVRDQFVYDTCTGNIAIESHRRYPQNTTKKKMCKDGFNKHSVNNTADNDVNGNNVVDGDDDTYGSDVDRGIDSSNGEGDRTDLDDNIDVDDSVDIHYANVK
ncbi:uncharacterized protein [Anoplolepis gracilipes]|uniref:uncharacterized protein n=1 Tax=Anoplolepis gracilipes TaxID=354296 RepID=UPI003B9F3734